MALEACEVYERLGRPEGELAIAQAVVFLACAAKSNAVYVAFGEAMEDAQKLGSLEVPLHLRNAPTRLMKELGYGKDYRYAHDEPDAYAAGENYFPEGMPRARSTTARCREDSRSRSPKRWTKRKKQARIQAARTCHFAHSDTMLDPKLLRSDPAAVAANLARRGFTLDVARLSALEESRKKWQVRADELRNERNVHAKSVGKAKAQGQDIAPLLKQVETLGAAADGGGEPSLRRCRRSSMQMALGLPNLLHESVPDGRDETANIEVRRWGEPRTFDFKPRDHVELGEKLGRCSTSRRPARSPVRASPCSRGALARLQRALIQFMLDLHTARARLSRNVCAVSRERAIADGHGTAAEVRSRPVRGPAASPALYLIPTAEVPVTNLVRDSIIEADALPLRFVAHTPCFRSEAGSYGKDTRGMIRQHQFEKVELVHFARPQDSYAEHETAHAQCRGSAEAAAAAVSRRRAVRGRHRLRLGEDLRPGSLAAGAAAPIARFLRAPTSRRSRRAACRRAGAIRRPASRSRCTRLNGSGVAAGRALVAVLENYQQADGSIVVPEALRGYMAGLEVIEPG